MTDVSLAAAFIAGLFSFLSPCVLPLVPGYISMLSGIGMEQLRQGEVPRSGLFSSAMAFVAGFSVVFIAFGASASAVGAFLKQNRNLLAPVAGALILLFGLHLIGALIKLKLRIDRKSTRLNSSHGYISYAVFCLKKKPQARDLLGPVGACLSSFGHHPPVEEGPHLSPSSVGVDEHALGVAGIAVGGGALSGVVDA